MKLMKCGCAPQGRDMQNNKEVCITHGEQSYMENQPSLLGRKAKCTYYGFCKVAVESREDLPFFKFRTREVLDEFYCGCQGWD